jgi:membrane dipeptidase
MKLLKGFPLLIFLFYACSNSEVRLVRKVDSIHESILTVDTHCDTPMEFADPGFDLGEKHVSGCVDFPRMAEGGLHSEFFAVFIAQGPRDDSSVNAAHEKAIRNFRDIRGNVEKNNAVAELTYSPDDAYKTFRQGRISAFIGLENGYPIGKDISRIRQYYDLGARYITLCHTRNNDICDSSTDSKGSEHNGLSDFGKEVVAEMNRLGIMVDVSHISDKSFYDVIKVTKAPVIASHSSCRALCENPRNMTDDMLLALKENGGVIQICILSNYVKVPEPNPGLDAKLKEVTDKYGDYRSLPADVQKKMREEYRAVQQKYQKLATVTDVVDHIDHVVQVIGIDHVGIGTDFDGGGGVDGCKTVSEMKNITIELLRRGYKKSDIEKIWSGNIMRVFREVESMRDKNLPQATF